MEHDPADCAWKSAGFMFVNLLAATALISKGRKYILDMLPVHHWAKTLFVRDLRTV